MHFLKVIPTRSLRSCSRLNKGCTYKVIYKFLKPYKFIMPIVKFNVIISWCIIFKNFTNHCKKQRAEYIT